MKIYEGFTKAMIHSLVLRCWLIKHISLQLPQNESQTNRCCMAETHFVSSHSSSSQSNYPGQSKERHTLQMLDESTGIAESQFAYTGSGMRCCGSLCKEGAYEKAGPYEKEKAYERGTPAITRAVLLYLGAFWITFALLVGPDWYVA